VAFAHSQSEEDYERPRRLSELDQMRCQKEQLDPNLRQGTPLRNTTQVFQATEEEKKAVGTAGDEKVIGDVDEVCGGVERDEEGAEEKQNGEDTEDSKSAPASSSVSEFQAPPTPVACSSDSAAQLFGGEGRRTVQLMCPPPELMPRADSLTRSDALLETWIKELQVRVPSSPNDVVECLVYTTRRYRQLIRWSTGWKGSSGLVGCTVLEQIYKVLLLLFEHVFKRQHEEIVSLDDKYQAMYKELCEAQPLNKARLDKIKAATEAAARSSRGNQALYSVGLILQRDALKKNTDELQKENERLQAIVTSYLRKSEEEDAQKEREMREIAAQGARDLSRAMGEMDTLLSNMEEHRSQQHKLMQSVGDMIEGVKGRHIELLTDQSEEFAQKEKERHERLMSLSGTVIANDKSDDEEGSDDPETADGGFLKTFGLVDVVEEKKKAKQAAVEQAAGDKREAEEQQVQADRKKLFESKKLDWEKKRRTWPVQQQGDALKELAQATDDPDFLRQLLFEQWEDLQKFRSKCSCSSSRPVSALSASRQSSAVGGLEAEPGQSSPNAARTARWRTSPTLAKAQAGILTAQRAVSFGTGAVSVTLRSSPLLLKLINTLPGDAKEFALTELNPLILTVYMSKAMADEECTDILSPGTQNSVKGQHRNGCAGGIKFNYFRKPFPTFIYNFFVKQRPNNRAKAEIEIGSLCRSALRICEAEDAESSRSLGVVNFTRLCRVASQPPNLSFETEEVVLATLKTLHDLTITALPPSAINKSANKIANMVEVLSSLDLLTSGHKSKSSSRASTPVSGRPPSAASQRGKRPPSTKNQAAAESRGFDKVPVFLAIEAVTRSFLQFGFSDDVISAALQVIEEECTFNKVGLKVDNPPHPYKVLFKQFVMHNLAESCQGHVNSLFEKWNKGGGAKIDKGALEAGCHDAGIELTDGMVEDLIDFVDTDKDGEISLADFSDAFERTHQIFVSLGVIIDGIALVVQEEVEKLDEKFTNMYNDAMKAVPEDDRSGGMQMAQFVNSLSGQYVSPPSSAQITEWFQVGQKLQKQLQETQIDLQEDITEHPGLNRLSCSTFVALAKYFGFGQEKTPRKSSIAAYLERYSKLRPQI